MAIYAACYIVRFEGTITQGPNMGKAYTLQSSWGGQEHETLDQARSLLAHYQELEPSIKRFQILSRQYVATSKRSGKFVETMIDDIF